MPRPVLSEQYLAIPDDVKIAIKSGVVTISGKRGELIKDFSHLQLDFEYNPETKKVVARSWFGNRKLAARIGTLFGLIKNMCTGVVKGFRYKMKYVYSHFPIKHVIENNGTVYSFTNFKGERLKQTLPLPKGTTIAESKGVKDEIVIEGPSVEDVAQVCARIHQMARIRNKDLRKFLDGIYVSEQGHIEE